jgi:hypothetical protein
MSNVKQQKEKQISETVGPGVIIKSYLARQLLFFRGW